MHRSWGETLHLEALYSLSDYWVNIANFFPTVGGKNKAFKSNMSIYQFEMISRFCCAHDKLLVLRDAAKVE